MLKMCNETASVSLIFTTNVRSLPPLFPCNRHPSFPCFTLMLFDIMGFFPVGFCVYVTILFANNLTILALTCWLALDNCCEHLTLVQEKKFPIYYFSEKFYCFKINRLEGLIMGFIKV